MSSNICTNDDTDQNNESLPMAIMMTIIILMMPFSTNSFNKVADNTFVNMVPVLLGKYVRDLPWTEESSEKPFDDHPLVWKNFSQRG